MVDTINALTAEDVANAIERFRHGYAPAGGFGIAFGPGRYDGVSKVRNFAFDARCACFGYTSDIYAPGA